MRLTLPELSAAELKLALAILAFDEDVRRSKRVTEADQTGEIRRLIHSAEKMDGIARVVAQRAAKPAKVKGRVWHYYFEEMTVQMSKDRLFREWREAAKILRENLERRAGWFPIPRIALPTKHTIPLITDPRDLVIWFSARLFANRQNRFFVRCKLCGRDALRKRSTAKYCGNRGCQELAKIEATYKRRGDNFSTWLLSQPKDRQLPPRMEMQRVNALRQLTQKTDN